VAEEGVDMKRSDVVLVVRSRYNHVTN